jgi:hypothetical protein
MNRRSNIRRPGRHAVVRQYSPVYAVGGFTAANYYVTASGGGEAGIDTGFGSVMFMVPDTLTGARFMQNRSNSNGQNGHLFFLSSASLSFFCGSGAAAAVISPAFTFTASDLGRPAAAIGWHDGSRVRLAVNSFPQQGSGTAITGYTSHNNTFNVSGVSGSPGTAPATGTRYIGGLTFRGVPTDAQLQELLSLFGRRWLIPTAAEWSAGNMLTHRWSVQDALAGTAVVPGQTGPASIADTVTAAGADALTRNGSPTVSIVGYR